MKSEKAFALLTQAIEALETERASIATHYATMKALGENETTLRIHLDGIAELEAAIELAKASRSTAYLFNGMRKPMEHIGIALKWFADIS